MPLDRMLNRGPRQFEIYQRILAYLIIALVTIVYYINEPNAKYQIYIPFLLVFILLISPRLSRWVQYYYDEDIRKNVFFILDVISLTIVMAGVHLSLVLSFALLMALICTAIVNRITFISLSLAALIGASIFYSCTFFVFGRSEYFQQTSIELTILAFLGIMLFIGVGGIYQKNQLIHSEQQKNHYFSEMNRYIELSNQLSRYAPLQLWQAIMRGESEAKLEYKRKKITIFFSDIQGFTEMSENLIPDDLAFLLNDYLSHMTEIAKQYGATIDKFMGDAILIFFGDPDSQGVEQDAKNCIDMAISMREQMKFLRERWLKMGYPALHIRMGISTGYCHVGNYGAMHRMVYTIVGRDANLAARLQDAAEIDEILVSNETHNLIKNHYLCAPKALVELKGIQGKVATWQVMEKYAVNDQENQQWFDYEYKGFHLLLNLEQVQNFEYMELVQVLEKMIERIQLQQQLTNNTGVAKLHLEDEIKSDYK